MGPAKGNEKQALVKKEQYGVPLAYVPNYEGIVTERRFHDIFFAIFFVVFIGACIGIGAWAFAKADRKHLDSGDNDFWNQQVRYVEKDTPLILGLCALALALALSWLAAIRKWPKFMIYMSIIVCAVLLIGSGIVQCIFGFSMAGGIAMGIWGVFCVLIGLLLLLFLKRRGASIEFTAVILTEAGNGLSQNASLMFVVAPIASFIFAAFYFAACAAIYFLFLVPGELLDPSANCDDIYYDNCLETSGCWWNQNTDTCEYTTRASAGIYLTLVIIFGIFWFGNMKIMFCDCVTAGTIAKWYFTRNFASYTSNVLSGVKNAFWAFGSLSFGALLIAIVQFFRMLLNSTNNGNSGFQLVIYCCLRFLCCILEGILRYISRYATIYIAMNGTNFWQSCKSVFNLLGRQSGWQAVMNDCLLGYINFVGSLVCFGVPTVIALFASGIHEGHWMTLVIVAVASCLIFVIIARCLRTAVDTIFVCFIEDMERNYNGMTFLSSPYMMGAMCRHTKRPASAQQYVNWQPPTSSTVQQGTVVVTGKPASQYV